MPGDAGISLTLMSDSADAAPVLRPVRLRSEHLPYHRLRAMDLDRSLGNLKFIRDDLVCLAGNDPIEDVALA